MVYKINKIITFLFIILPPIQIIFYKRINKKLSNLCINLQKLCAKNYMVIVNFLSNVDYLKQLPDTDKIVSKIRKNIKQIHSENSKVNFLAGLLGIISEFFVGIIQNSIYIFAAFLLLNNKIEISNYVFLNLISGLYFSSINSIVKTNINFRDMEGIDKFIKEELIANIEREGEENINEIQKIQMNIDKISFGDKEILSNCNFIIKKNDILGIIGKSGCGKSTIAKSLLRFYDFGQIYINDKPIERYNLKSLRSKISYFSQNIPIFQTSILENFFFDIDFSDEKLNKLKDKVYFNKFLETEKMQNEIILENGANLSGGDKQKIAIARAFLEDCDLIILDEITNSIDKKDAEKIIVDLIKEYKNKIIIIISHDLSLYKHCNKLLIIENGKTYFTDDIEIIEKLKL